MKYSFFFILIVVCLFNSLSIAKPKIEFDTKTFNCGTFFEGKIEKLNASFNVKNTGDAVLKLQDVRPSCGCTIVKFDSTIQPGKSSAIKSSVNIQGAHSGKISKTIAITSNAGNEPTIRLTIEATLQAFIDVSESFLNFNSSQPKVIQLASPKADLKIIGVDFKSSEANDQASGWQANLSLPLKYSIAAKDSTRADGYSVFALTLFAPMLDNQQSGQIAIKTNHPDKQEITIQAHIVSKHELSQARVTSK